jgi:hypothetical protein
MSCRIFAASGLSPATRSISAIHFAGCEPVDSERRHMRAPDPRRDEFRPVGDEQQESQGLDLVHETDGIAPAATSSRCRTKSPTT